MTAQQTLLEKHYAKVTPQAPIHYFNGSELNGQPSPQEREMLRGVHGHALDVGAGSGDFVGSLASVGFKASGLEAFDPHAEVARGRGLDVRTGRFGAKTLQAAFGDQRFNLVSFRESLCYLDVAEALELARQRLVPAGFLYVKSCVADSPYYWFGAELRGRLGAWCTVCHTAEGLVGFINSSGFEVVKVRRASINRYQIAKGWRLPLPLACLVPTSLLPPDRVHVLARKT